LAVGQLWIGRGLGGAEWAGVCENRVYIQPFQTVKPSLEKIRKLIQAKVPNAKEAISYQMPAFKLGRTFIYFAAFKKHVGIYPPVKNNKNLSDELRPFSSAKGNLKFYWHKF
jgi:uncharacterized protein YdhG (YjbR/CyaY superfamily)